MARAVLPTDTRANENKEIENRLIANADGTANAGQTYQFPYENERKSEPDSDRRAPLLSRTRCRSSLETFSKLSFL